MNQQPDPSDDLDDGLIRVNRREEVPNFTSETEEREFWDTHCLGSDLLAGMRRRGPAGAATRERRGPSQLPTVV